MTHQDDTGHAGEEKEREAIGGFLSPARHAPDDEQSKEPLGAAHSGPRDSSPEPGPPGEVTSRVQATSEDHGGLAPSAEEGTEEMTAAEVSGQVPSGAGDTSGQTGATGAESSSG